MSTKPPLVIARPRRPPPVFICRKCLKRADDGRAIKSALKTELKQRAKANGGKRARVITTSCFGICPKRAVVLASDTTLQRGEYVLVAGSGDVAEAVGVLKPGERSDPEIGVSRGTVGGSRGHRERNDIAAA